MTDTAEQKYSRLLEMIGSLDGAVVAFSGGVDSSLLLAAAVEALGQRALAVTGRSPSLASDEYDVACEVAAQLQARHQTIDTDEIDNPEYQQNSTTRCFVCKSTLFTALQQLARDEGLAMVLEGSNADDTSDFRPGMEAAHKLGVRAPLVEVGLSKDEIRELAKARQIPVWDKPSLACLASRVPYGSRITRQRLARIEQAELAVRARGFRQLRVRDHGVVARIEVGPQELDRLLDPDLRQELSAAVKEAGFKYVALDLDGYRTGAMNEVLDRPRG